MMVSRKACLLGDRCVPLTFRQRLCCAVEHHEDLRAEQIAERANIPYRWLRAYCADSADHHIPAESLIAIVRVTGRVDLLEHLARECGLRVVRPPDQISPEELVAEALDVTAAHGELVGALRKAMRDGCIRDHERAELLERARRVQRELAEMESALGGTQ